MLMRTSADLAELGANTSAKPILQKFLSLFLADIYFFMLVKPNQTILNFLIDKSQ
jgi:hypothetical protein